jgi:agmatine deiminase
MADQDQPSPMPRDLGYSMPAEWVPHRATWLSWPHNQETWPAQLERVRDAWVQMIQALSPHEKVYLLVNDDPMQQDVRLRLKAAGAAMENVAMIKIPTVDVWMRDYGPTFVLRTRQDVPLAINDWIFNGWGGKYRAYEHDDKVARSIAELLNVPVFEHRVVLEGGAIEVNGAGICLTTEQCLLNKNRNPHLSRAEIEQFLKDSLGVSQIIWLGEGVAGDDTDGHIDDIARFVDPTTVVCAVEDDPGDANYVPSQENLERLEGARDHNGSRLDIIALPSPRPVLCQGSRLPASYANFYIANEVVLVPIFDDRRDRKALGILSELFPTRKAIAIRCADVVAGLGAIHCVTQQEPKIAASRA